MNQLIEASIKNRYKIGAHRISQSKWKDIGQLEDYKKNMNL